MNCVGAARGKVKYSARARPPRKEKGHKGEEKGERESERERERGKDGRMQKASIGFAGGHEKG